MNVDLDDQALLRDFAKSGSDTAFGQLVHRHAGLVLGTALRLARDRSGAEEITQNVFIALARKAPFLPRDTCVAAWLHRSAILEAKNWLRSEIRRRKREESSGGDMNQSDESLLEALSPVLDEALLDLSQSDRAALLLRFFEQQSLRDVGTALGVTEDTAQKRVGKAVEMLTRAFRKRGYTVPAVAMTVTVLERAATAASPELCRIAAGAALAAAGPASLTGFMLLAANFMSLTKLQTATVCLLLAAAPASVQWQLTREVRADNFQAQNRYLANTSLDASLRAQRAELQRSLSAAHSDVLALQVQLNQMTAALPPSPPPEQLYTWSTTSDYVRLPKAILANLRLTSKTEFYRPGDPQPFYKAGKVVEGDGRISPVLLEALGLDSAQSAAVQHAFFNFATDFKAIEAARTSLTNAKPPGVGFNVPDGEQIIAYHTAEFEEDGLKLRTRLAESLRGVIGEERAEILLEKQAASDLRWTFREFGKYDDWVAAVRQDGGYFTLAKSQSHLGTSYNASVSTVTYDQLPDQLKQHFLPPPESPIRPE